MCYHQLDNNTFTLGSSYGVRRLASITCSGHFLCVPEVEWRMQSTVRPYLIGQFSDAMRAEEEGGNIVRARGLWGQHP
jgi:hypothetical protein